MKRVPIYNVRTWRVRSADELGIVLRPSFKTFTIRLQATIVFAALIGLIEYSAWRVQSRADARPPLFSDAERADIARQSDELRESMRLELGDEATDRIERDAAAQSEARQAEHEAAQRRVDRIGEWLRIGRFTLDALLAACGILPPLVCVWSRVTIRKSARGEISIFALGLLPRRQIWPENAFERLRTYAMERYWFGRHRVVTKHAWEWYVQLAPPGLANMPVTMTMAWAGKELPPQFLVHRQKYQPGTKDRAPEPVREFVKALRALLDLPADQPQIVEARLHRGLFQTRVSHRMPAGEIAIPISKETRTYNSLEDMPEDVRDTMRDLLESGDVTRREDGSVEIVKRREHVIDTAGGRVRPEDIAHLPPDIQHQIQEAIRRTENQ